MLESRDKKSSLPGALPIGQRGSALPRRGRRSGGLLAALFRPNAKRPGDQDEEAGLAELRGPGARRGRRRAAEELDGEPVPTDAPAPAPRSDTVGQAKSCAYGGPLAPTRHVRWLQARVLLENLLPSRLGILLAAVLAGGLWLAFNLERELDLRESDRNVVPTADALARVLGTFFFIQSAETLEKTRHLGGRHELRYTYSTSLARQPEIHAVVAIEPTVMAARRSFRLSQLNTVVDWDLDPNGEIGLVELDEGFSWGEESRAFLVLDGGEPIGTSFAGYFENRTVYLRLRGVGFQTGEELAEFLEPPLIALESWVPSGAPEAPPRGPGSRGR